MLGPSQVRSNSDVFLLFSTLFYKRQIFVASYLLRDELISLLSNFHILRFPAKVILSLKELLAVENLECITSLGSFGPLLLILSPFLAYLKYIIILYFCKPSRSDVLGSIIIIAHPSSSLAFLEILLVDAGPKVVFKECPLYLEMF